MRALPLGVGAALLSRPRRASASPGAIFDPTKYPTETGFTADGDPNFTVSLGTELSISDTTAFAHLGFFGPPVSPIGDGYELRARLRINTAANTPVLDGVDTGVRVGFRDGARQYLAGLIQNPGNDRRVALMLIPQDPMTPRFSTGIAWDWGNQFVCTIRRTSTGAELVLGTQTESALAQDLPAASRTSIEFGCFSDPALATPAFESIVQPAGPIPVAIKIKPGSDTASINLRSARIIPVAILSSPTFDATPVDPATVSLAGAKVKLIGKGNRYSCADQDVNGDGLPDLLCHVVTADFMLEPGESIAVLEAETYDGRDIRGQDSVRIVP